MGGGESVLQFGVKIFYTFQTQTLYAACTAHPILLDLTMLIIFYEI